MLQDLKVRKYIFYTFMGLTIIFLLIPFILLDTYELGYSIQKALKLKILFIGLSFLFSFYTNDIMFRPTKAKNKTLKKIIDSFTILFGAFLTFMFFCGLTSGLLLTINAFIGKQELININTTVLDTQTTSSKGTKSYYISIKIPDDERTVELKVERPFLKGENYQNQLYKGSLKMYYK